MHKNHVYAKKTKKLSKWRTTRNRVKNKVAMTTRVAESVQLWMVSVYMDEFEINVFTWDYWHFFCTVVLWFVWLLVNFCQLMVDQAISIWLGKRNNFLGSIACIIVSGSCVASVWNNFVFVRPSLVVPSAPCPGHCGKIGVATQNVLELDIVLRLEWQTAQN